MDVIAWERDVRLIAMLCQELARLGASVRLTDTRPTLLVHDGNNDHMERVVVRGSGTCFEWRDGGQRHPVADPEGAALRIAALVRPAARRPAGVAGDPAEPATRLVDACCRAGLAAEIVEPYTKVRVNVVAGTDRTAEVIKLRAAGDGVLSWWWSWDEPIGPAAETDQAAATIAAVVPLVDPR